MIPFYFDTSGLVAATDGLAPVASHYDWTALSPFQQGYILAMIDAEEDALRFPVVGPGLGQGVIGFSLLAPETLARVIADCDAAFPRYVIPGYPGGPQSGQLFWIDRQSPEHIHGFTPLSLSLGEDGLIRFNEVPAAPAVVIPRLAHRPHLFPDVRAAASALSAYLAEWSGYLQWSIDAVHSGRPVAYDGFTVQARDFSGKPVGYLSPPSPAMIDTDRVLAGIEERDADHARLTGDRYASHETPKP